MSVFDRTPCANCHHAVAAHGVNGCFVGSALDASQHCACPFEYRDGNFNARALPVLCQATYTVLSGRVVTCISPAGHTGLHQGYYHPTDARPSSWSDKEGDKPVIEAAPDEPRCSSHHHAAPGDGRCIKPAEHPAEHRTGFGIQDLCWYDDAQGAYTKVRDEQVGGDHYRQFKIQPWDIWKEYSLDPWLAGVVKYILRAGHKGPKLEDLKKARHYLDAAIEIEENK